MSIHRNIYHIFYTICIVHMFNTVKNTVIPIFVVKIVKKKRRVCLNSHEGNFSVYILPAGNHIQIHGPDA